MSSKTKIVVLHMKEIIYTAVFVVLGIFLILLLFHQETPISLLKNPMLFVQVKNIHFFVLCNTGNKIAKHTKILKTIKFNPK